VRRLGHQHGEVGARALEGAVHHVVRRLDERRLLARLGLRAARHAPHDEKAPFGGGGVALHALHRHRDRPALARREVELELGAALGAASGETRRLRAERDARAARQAVHGLVVEGGVRRPERPRAHLAAARAPVAADLEEVGEVGAEVERKAQLAPHVGVARDGEELVAAGLPQELGARDVKRILREQQRALGIEEIRIGEVHVQHHVIRLHGGGEHHRPMAFEGEVQPREETRVVMKEARRRVLELEDVAELVEHGEAVAVLERAPARGRERDDARNDHRVRRELFGLHAAAMARRRPSARYTAR